MTDPRGNGAGGPMQLPSAAALEAMRTYGMRPAYGTPPLGGRPDMTQSAGPPGMGLEPHIFHQPGGDILLQLQHPAWETIEELYRVLPEEGWFNPNLKPAAPVKFELGAFTVPVGHQFWLFNYEFMIFVLSGIDPGDIVPAEPWRFGSMIGFDITVNGKRSAHLLYQLDPVPVQNRNQSFDPPVGSRRTSPDEFNRAASASFASTASPGLSLLPARQRVQGAPHVPFTIVCNQGDRVSLSCVIFKTVTSPIGTIQGSLSGYLMHTNVSEALIQRMRPR